MTDSCTIQLYSQGRWADVAAVTLFGAVAEGWRVHADLQFRQRALFIPRFDRRLGASGLERLGQESIASLTGLSGWDQIPSHDAVCRALRKYCSNPAIEILEYLRLDVANVALGNKDNHARNTAIQRDVNGRIALTPLFDFAPMFLHPDGIARRMRWDGNDAGRPNWSRVLDTLCETDSVVQRGALVNGLQAMVPALHAIANRGVDWGMESEVLHFLKPGILEQADQLERLR